MNTYKITYIANDGSTTSTQFDADSVSKQDKNSALVIVDGRAKSLICGEEILSIEEV